MTSKIRVLDEHTINKIAAGEVIENPASVVKELVENAIDAGSTEVCVEIKAGGRQLIRVTDNGCGMNRDDALLSLERHATSKIRSVEDIYSIGSMGFRGEAVPSIASISKMTILTCDGEGKTGTLIIVDGGKIVSCSTAVRSQGTTIEVKSLFFNVPVRKKFQRSPAYDAAEILKVVSMQALAHPEIKFQLIHNQTNELNTMLHQSENFHERLGERVAAVLGSDFKTSLKPVSLSKDKYQVEGFIGLPSYTRHNRTGQYLFINKRAVFSPFISYAVREGYGTALGTNRHPVFVLHVSMPGSHVDVNVHPQKREVRLHQEQAIKEALIHAIEKALHQRESLTRGPVPEFEERPYPFFQNPFPSYSFPPKSEEPKVISPFIPPMPQMQEVECVSEETESPSFHFNKPEKDPIPQVIATMRGYLLTRSNSNELRLIDQHAAHRRILFEKLERQSDRAEPVHMQNLLIPESLEVNALEAAIVRGLLEELNKLGIAIQEFGQNTFLIQAIPISWMNIDICRFIQEIIHDLKDAPESSTAKFDKTKRLVKVASKAAVSQKTILSIQEGQALVKQLLQCSQPAYCPYGNPTIIELGGEEIAKLFQRSK